MTASIRVGAVNYLNTKPLIHGLEAATSSITLDLDWPSRLADRLVSGDLDVALIPVIEYLRANRYTIVPGIAIASAGPVLSVTLFSRVPWSAIGSVALDVGSRTSAALTEVLLRYRHGIRAEYRPLPMEADPETVSADAVLLIGDRAMRACLPGFDYAFDLGREWHDWTGLPFVYAVWAVREGVELGAVVDELHAAKQRGQRAVGLIAQRESARLGLDAGYCRRYLTDIIRFDLGQREEAGLRTFHRLAADIGLAPQEAVIEYHTERHLVQSH